MTMKSIELFGTKVAPVIRKETGFKIENLKKVIQ